MSIVDQFTELINKHNEGIITIRNLNMKSGNNVFLKRSLPGTLRIEGDAFLWEEISSGPSHDNAIVHFLSELADISHISYTDGFDETYRTSKEDFEHYPISFRKYVENFLKDFQ